MTDINRICHQKGLLTCWTLYYDCGTSPVLVIPPASLFLKFWADSRLGLASRNSMGFQLSKNRMSWRQAIVARRHNYDCCFPCIVILELIDGSQGHSCGERNSSKQGLRSEALRQPARNAPKVTRAECFGASEVVLALHCGLQVQCQCGHQSQPRRVRSVL